MKKHTLAALILLLPGAVWASAMPYVKPESLWPFRAFEGLMLVLGFFAAYRAIRSHLPRGDDKPANKNEDLKNSAATENPAPPRTTPKKGSQQVLAALRVAGFLFMVAGSFLGFHAGGIDYGPAHLDELTTRIFGGALFLVGLSDFFILPKLMAGKSRPDRL